MFRTLNTLLAAVAICISWPLDATAQFGAGNQGVQGSLTLLEVEGDQGLLFIRGVNFGNRPVIFLSGVVLDILDRHPVATCIKLPDGSVVAACEEIVAAVPDPLPIDPPRGIGPRQLVLTVATGPISFWPRPQTESVDVIVD